MNSLLMLVQHKGNIARFMNHRCVCSVALSVVSETDMSLAVRQFAIKTIISYLSVQFFLFLCLPRCIVYDYWSLIFVCIEYIFAVCAAASPTRTAKLFMSRPSDTGKELLSSQRGT